MNTGIVDAYTLGRLLTNVLQGRASEESLATYEVMRRPAAVQVLKLAGRMTDAATVRSPLRRFLRNVVLSTLTRISAIRRRIEMDLSGLSRAALTVKD